MTRLADRIEDIDLWYVRLTPCRACCGWHVGYRRITELLRRRKEDPV
jgi:hypothetical protein